MERSPRDEAEEGDGRRERDARLPYGDKCEVRVAIRGKCGWRRERAASREGDGTSPVSCRLRQVRG